MPKGKDYLSVKNNKTHEPKQNDFDVCMKKDQQVHSRLKNATKKDKLLVDVTFPPSFPMRNVLVKVKRC